MHLHRLRSVLCDRSCNSSEHLFQQFLLHQTRHNCCTVEHVELTSSRNSSKTPPFVCKITINADYWWKRDFVDGTRLEPRRLRCPGLILGCLIAHSSLLAPDPAKFYILSYPSLGLYGEISAFLTTFTGQVNVKARFGTLFLKFMRQFRANFCGDETFYFARTSKSRILHILQVAQLFVCMYW